MIDNMNKIKARVNLEQFTPWQDSLDNVFKSMEADKRRKPFNNFDSLQPPSPTKSPKRKQKAKSIMSRTFLNLSKINLHDSESHNSRINSELQHSQSRRYSGPRITFYAQMNPKIGPSRSKSCLNPEEEKSKENINAQKVLTGRMVRDESIKYLQIIDEKPKEEKQGQKSYYFPKAQNSKKIGVVQARKSDEQHIYLRRLKMIYRKN